MSWYWVVFWRVPWNGRGREATDAVRRRAGRGPRAPQRERRGSASALGVSPREPDGVGDSNEHRNAQLMLVLQRFIGVTRPPLHRRGKWRGQTSNFHP